MKPKNSVFFYQPPNHPTNQKADIIGLPEDGDLFYPQGLLLSVVQFLSDRLHIYFLPRRLSTLFKVKIVIVFCCFLESSKVQSQTIDFCGEMPSNTAISLDPDSIFFDRFGNSYDIISLNEKFDNGNISRSIGSYFELSLDVEPELESVIEDVFIYLSSIIDQRINNTGCLAEISPSRVRIFIGEDESVTDPVLASGTPHFYGWDRLLCDEVIINRVDLRMNGGLNDGGVDGSILINPDPDYDWYLGTGTPGSTVILP